MFQKNWREHFRYDTFRPGQEESIDSTARHLDGDKKFIICEDPTGIGKSDKAIALGLCTTSAYITTSQNILIDQYEKDFGDYEEFRSVRGRRHYGNDGNKDSCPHFSNCDEGGRDRDNTCGNGHYDESNVCGYCPYLDARDQALNAKLAFMNGHYYSTATVNQEVWNFRNLTVFDEAHNIESILMSLVEFTLYDKDLKDLSWIQEAPDKPPSYWRKSKYWKKGDVEAIDADEFYKWVEEIIPEMARASARSEGNYQSGLIDSGENRRVKELANKVRRFHMTFKFSEWIVDKQAYGKSLERVKYTARPLTTGFFAKRYLYNQAEKFVFQSATIVDPKRFASDLGIREGEFEYVKTKPPFPEKNRPVYLMPVGSLSRRNFKDNCMKLVDEVARIINCKEGKKGLVHTGSYKMARFLEENLPYNERYIFPKAGEREAAWNKHEWSRDTVIFSPSFTEGVDGKYDLCRFQILAKVPYPDLGDRRTYLRSQRDQGWYNYMTCKTILQAIGRGCRAMDDTCDTYLLDQDFEGLFRRSDVDFDWYLGKALIWDRSLGERSLIHPAEEPVRTEAEL